MSKPKYKIYRWYGWSFKHWYLMGEYNTVEQVANALKGKRTMTYAVLCNGKVIKTHIGSLRYGMSYPNFNHIPDYE